MLNNADTLQAHELVKMRRPAGPSLKNRLQACEIGAAAVEFAIVAWVFILFVLGIIEVGRALDTRNQVSRAVDAAARTVLVPKAGSMETNAQNAAKAALTTANQEHLELYLKEVDVSGVMYRKIEATYHFSPLLTGILSATIDMKVDRYVCPVSECTTP